MTNRNIEIEISADNIYYTILGTREQLEELVKNSQKK